MDGRCRLNGFDGFAVAISSTFILSFPLVLMEVIALVSSCSYIFILLPLLLRLILYGEDHEDRRTTNDEYNLYRYLYLLP